VVPANGIGVNFFDLAINLPGVDLAPGCSVYLTETFFPLSMFTLDGLGAASTPLQLPSRLLRHTRGEPVLGARTDAARLHAQQRWLLRDPVVSHRRGGDPRTSGTSHPAARSRRRSQ
jgi:hypothetical protein